MMDDLLEHQTVLENGVRYKLKTYADGLVVRDGIVPPEVFDAPKPEPLFNKAMREYLRATGIQWRYWDNNEYEFCVHLMNEFGIGAKPVTDATWEAVCCHWGIGIGGDLMEAVFKCYLDYVNDVVIEVTNDG